MDLIIYQSISHATRPRKLSDRPEFCEIETLKTSNSVPSEAIDNRLICVISCSVKISWSVVKLTIIVSSVCERLGSIWLFSSEVCGRCHRRQKN